jgi:hypothetical protein
MNDPLGLFVLSRKLSVTRISKPYVSAFSLWRFQNSSKERSRSLICSLVILRSGSLLQAQQAFVLSQQTASYRCYKVVGKPSELTNPI